MEEWFIAYYRRANYQDMSTSDWIAIGSIAVGLFVTIIGSALLLSFKIGGVNEKVMSIEKCLEKLTDTVDRLKVDVTEIKVKLEVLWTDHLSKNRVPKGKEKGQPS